MTRCPGIASQAENASSILVARSNPLSYEMGQSSLDSSCEQLSHLVSALCGISTRLVERHS